MARISEKEADNYQSSLQGEWFSLKNDKDVARVQFMMNTMADLDVYACHKVKVGDRERYVDCLRTYDEPIDNCPFCAAGLPVKPVRYVMMYQHDDNKVKIWERGRTFITKLQSMCNRYNPLSDYVFEIERHGKPGDMSTKYEIFPMDRVDAVDLTDVERPDILGGIILDKSEEDMRIYLETGSFPSTDDTADNFSYDRRGATAQRGERRAADQGASRRGEAREQQSTTRGPARGSRRSVDTEVF